jgi:Ulp1 family protease
MRKEITSLKQQLADSLGDMAKDYWNALQDYLLQKITKQELDNVLMTLFTTPQQAKLHNKLIYIILMNTTMMAPLPQGADLDFSAQNPRKRQQTDHLFGEVLKKRFNTKVVLSLPPQERSRLHQIQTVPEIQEQEEEPLPKGNVS